MGQNANNNGQKSAEMLKLEAKLREEFRAKYEADLQAKLAEKDAEIARLKTAGAPKILAERKDGFLWVGIKEATTISKNGKEFEGMSGGFRRTKLVSADGTPLNVSVMWKKAKTRVEAEESEE